MQRVNTGSGEAAHVQGYLHDAVASIDAALGKGYAAAHPELVGAFITACSQDRIGTVLFGAVSDGLDGIGKQISSVASNLG